MLPSANEFCTLTDLRFLPQALVLQESLAAVCQDYRLRIFCLDDISLSVLNDLAPYGCEPVPFSRVEKHDPELRAVASGRTRAEYCWTATPAVCRYVLDVEPGLETITYLDADLMFFSDPASVLGELGDDSVLLFPQRIASRDQAWSEAVGDADASERLTDRYGKFNAGSITFRNDLRGRAALDWWRERCLEWCFDRFEPGHWADQRYLSDLPAMFPGISVASHAGAALAPWNSNTVELRQHDGRLLVDGVPVVFHHYQSLQVQRAVSSRLPWGWLPNVYRLRVAGQPLIARHAAWYALTARERRLLWNPYVERLDRAIAAVARLTPVYARAVPELAVRQVAADANHAAYLKAYHLLGTMIPGPARVALSRARTRWGGGPQPWRV